MRVALISTVYNEAATVDRWIEALRRQSMRPDEFVIVDGGSTDATVALLEKGFADGKFTKPRIITQRCNIAEGRNIAIRNTTAEIIVTIDGGSEADPNWLEEITRPFREHPDVHAVGGWCPMAVKQELHAKIERAAGITIDDIPTGGSCSPSSRNAAFRRTAWEAVGVYPEWLTLAAEDFVFNLNMQFAGFRFYFQPTALVSWETRPDLRSYLKMLKSYGYGCAEAGQATRKYLRWLGSVLCPPVMLFSRSRWSDRPFKYASHAAAVYGWILGKLFGRKPPADWKWVDGIWASPQAIATARKKNYSAANDR